MDIRDKNAFGHPADFRGNYRNEERSLFEQAAKETGTDVEFGDPYLPEFNRGCFGLYSRDNANWGAFWKRVRELR